MAASPDLTAKVHTIIRTTIGQYYVNQAVTRGPTSRRRCFWTNWRDKTGVHTTLCYTAPNQASTVAKLARYGSVKATSASPSLVPSLP